MVKMMAQRWPHLTVVSTEPGFVKTKMTAGNDSMPSPMRFMANFVASSPQKAALRCFDHILETGPPSGSIIQSSKVMDDGSKKWATPEARANLEALLEKAGLSG